MSDTEKNLDSLRVAPAELKVIGGLTAQDAGPSVEAFFQANKSRLADLVAGVMRPERLLKVAQTAIRTTPGLKQCTVASLFGAVVVCAIMGLEPNTHEGLCWLIPRKSSQPRRNDRGVLMTDSNGGWIWDERWEVNVQVGYKGHIALAYRNPMVKLIHTGIIHENDEYRIIEGTNPRIEHFPRTAGERGEPIIFYAICKLDTGETLFEWMSRGQVERIRDQFSDAYASAETKRQQALAILARGGPDKAMAKAQRDLEKAEDAPWIRDFDQMARKTLINRIRNYIPSNRQSALAETLDTKDMQRQSQNLARFLDHGDLDGEFEATDEPQGGQISHDQTQGQTIDAALGSQKQTVTSESQPGNTEAQTAPTHDLTGAPTPWFADVPLSGRARAAASKGAEYGAVTLEQAAGFPRDWWLKLPGVGEAAYAQIEVALKSILKAARTHKSEPHDEPHREPLREPHREPHGETQPDTGHAADDPADADRGESGFGDPV